MNTKKKLILTIILLSYFVTAIDASIVITGVTKIAADLQLSPSLLSWVQNAYVLAWGGFMLLGGRLSDTFGRKPVLNLSLVLFGIGSLLAGIAWSATVMIAARFIQGVGSAILAPTSLALIMDYFEGTERVKAVAWYSSISGLGLCFGLVFGGAITSFLSWRDGFLVNLPLIVFMLAISAKVLQRGETKKDPFDIRGTLLSVIGIFAFVYAINGAGNAWLWLGVALLAMAAFIRVESKAAVPVMPLRLFSSSVRWKAYVARALFVGAMMGFNFMISEYMQGVYGFTPLEAGLGFLPATVSTFLAAIEVPHLVGKWGNRSVLAFGLAFLFIGFVWFSLLDAGSPYLTGVALPMVVLGTGNGLTLSPLTNLGIEGVKPEDSGAASGLVNASHQIGGAIGLSMMVTAGAGLSDMAARCTIGMVIATMFILIAFAVTFSHSFRKTVRGHKIYDLFGFRIS